jgi:hypothetical protein
MSSDAALARDCPSIPAAARHRAHTCVIHDCGSKWASIASEVLCSGVYADGDSILTNNYFRVRRRDIGNRLE